MKREQESLAAVVPDGSAEDEAIKFHVDMNSELTKWRGERRPNMGIYAL